MDSLYLEARKVTSEPRVYFAFVEKVDFFGANDNRVHIRFDCILEKDARTLIESLLSDALLSEMPFIHIECFATKNKWVRIFRQQMETLEDRWVLIETLPKTTDRIGIVANEFYNGIAQEVIHRIVLRTPDKDQILTTKRLIQKFDLKKIKRAKRSSSLKTLVKAKLLPSDWVVVSNVGQGNLNFITSNKIPAVYFDLGGGTGTHHGTYGVTKITCKTNDPLVILSHWDMDHLETAFRDRSNCTLKWVVPDQRVGKTHLTLAWRIARVGQLWVWPTSLKEIRTSNGHVVKCTGKTKNDSGLAAFIFLNRKKILLSADAVYKSIPSARTYRLSCMVCSHHGSNSSARNVPAASGVKWIAYSYGRPNSWGHATLRAKTQHRAQGWTKSLRTTKGCIAFDTANYLCPCGTVCNLSSAQHY